MNINYREAEFILAATSPSQLYPADAASAQRRYRELASYWHPDRCGDPRATEVLTRARELFEEANRRLASGLWISHKGGHSAAPGHATFNAIDGREYRLKFRSCERFELGFRFSGDQVAAFAVAEEHADLFDRGVEATRHYACADPRMAAEIERYLPRRAAVLHCPEWRVLVLHKSADLYPLRDVQNYLTAPVDARHVAWIVSALLNIACYLEYANRVHNGIDRDAIWISPRDHYCALLGGWWYAAPSNAAMVAAPRSVLRHAPSSLARTRLADPRTDLEAIRAVGRELLGDADGTRLGSMKTAPAPMIDWLRHPAPVSALEDFQFWRETVLVDAFGGRRFTAMAVDARDIYPTAT